MTMINSAISSSNTSIAVINDALAVLGSRSQNENISPDKANRLDETLHQFLNDCADILDLPSHGEIEDKMSLLASLMHSTNRQLAPKVSFVSRVKTEIHALLSEGAVSIEQLADKMAVSTRTLQRRLTTENLTFSELMDDLRKDYALTLLRDASIPITEAAYELGFSEPSTFYRAFKRWTGETPAGYRKTFAH